MESFPEARALREESLQMGGLNRRLEAYLARVQSLEEENAALQAQVQLLRGGPPEGSWRARGAEEVAALRAAVDRAVADKHAAELARAGLQEEARLVRGRCQKERAAREDARRLLAAGRQQLDEEARGQLWLRQRAAQLEQELRALADAHREERAALGEEAAARSPERRRVPAAAAAPFPPGQVEDFAARLCGAWRGAVETYRAEVAQLEASCAEAVESLGAAADNTRHSQLRLQRLEGDLAGLRARKEALQERLARQWQQQQGEAEQLQLAIEELEEEKRALGVQIAQVLEDRQQLMHLKMSLSLEVATYRTLLEAESMRLQMPAEHKLAISLQGCKLETSSSKRQAASLERGHLGSQEPRPSPAPFLKRGLVPQLPPAPDGSISLPPQRGQKASAGLQAQPSRAFDGVGGPAVVDSLQTEAATAPASQLLDHASPLLFGSIRPTVPNGMGEPGSNSEESHLTGEGGGEVSAEMKAKEWGGEVMLYAEVEEEGKQPSEEPPWKAPVRNVPYPSQLVTEALETALRDVQSICFEAGPLDAADTPNGIASDDSSSLEEDNGAAPAPSTAAFEEATPKEHKSQLEGCASADLLEGVKSLEDLGEAGSWREASPEEQAEEAGGRTPQDGLPSSPQGADMLEEEGGLSAQRNGEETVEDLPVAEETDSSNTRRDSWLNEGGNSQPPISQGVVQRNEWEEVSQCTASAGHLDKDAAARSKGQQESSEPSTNHPEDHSGAPGADSEEASGGAEDLEVVSTEALHLSTDEERRALSSPSRESKECDCQAEMREGELLQTEEFATETWSPASHSIYSAESHQDPHFLRAEQEPSEEEAPFYKTGSAFPEEEGDEKALDPETACVEEAVLREEHSMQALSSRPWAVQGAEKEQGPEQQVLGNRDRLEGEDARGKEGTMETKETMASVQEGACRPAAALQQESMETVLWQETSEGEQREEAGGVYQGVLPAEEKTEANKTTMASRENGVLEGEGLRTGSGAVLTEETEAEASLVKKEERVGYASAGDLQEKENPGAKQAFKADAPQAEEEPAIAEREDDDNQRHHSLPFGQSLLQESGTGALEIPSEGPNSITRGWDGKPPSGPQDVQVFSERDPQLQSDCSGSEVSLESLDISPNVSCEAEGMEKKLEGSRPIQLEETLPDNTPLHLYGEAVLAVPEDQEAAEAASFGKENAASIEATEPAVGEACPISSLAENDGARGVEGAGEDGDRCSESDAPTSEELLASKDSEEAKAETWELIRDNEELCSREASKPSLEEHFPPLDTDADEQPGAILEPGSGTREEPACTEMLHEETCRADLAWEAERDGVFQAGEPHPCDVQEGAPREEGRPSEWSDPDHPAPEVSHKVSPLTSVADLGEIVLEEEQSQDGQESHAESEGLACDKDRSALCVQEPQLSSGQETCGGEDPSCHTDVAEVNPGGKDLMGPLLNTAASLPIDSLKDSDILEIVEQALEFNHELIGRAAEQALEAEQLPARRDGHHSPEEEGSGSLLALPVADGSQVLAETPNAPSPHARDPPGLGPLWVEDDAIGRRQDSSLADFTSEVLNGDQERRVSSAREVLVEEVTAGPHIHREDLDDLSTLGAVTQTHASEEGRGAGDICSAVPEDAWLEQSGQEGLCVEKCLFTKRVPAVEVESMSNPPKFGAEILHLESSQHLKFRPEDEEEFWPPEDN